VTVALRGFVELPAHARGGFDHADVHLASGRVFVAHTANGTVDVINGEDMRCERTIEGCPEGSGVLCVEGELVFAAARGAGKVLVINPLACEVRREIGVGPKPNGLAWDPRRRQLLVADVEDFRARLVSPSSGETLAVVDLPGRPRWCIYDTDRDRFLVNIREPACVVALAAGAGAMAQTARIEVSAAGPHGLDLDRGGQRAFVACDEGILIVLDLHTSHELARLEIAGEPDVVWYNRARESLYVAIGQPGVIDVVDCRAMRLAERVATEPGAHTTAFDPQRQRLYVFVPRRCGAMVYALAE
jgi:DNA-binding beta-propeller fold protein YncE